VVGWQHSLLVDRPVALDPKQGDANGYSTMLERDFLR